MRLGIVAIQLQPQVMGGSEVYLRDLIAMCRTMTSLERYAVLASRKNFAALHGMESSDAVQIVRPSFFQIARRAFIWGLHHFQTQPYVGQLHDWISLDGFDVLHYPFNVILPRIRQRGRTKIVVTVHDLQERVHPQFFSRAEVEYRQVHYRYAVENADLVLAISQYTKDSILSSYAVSPERVSVVHHGIDLDYYCPGDENGGGASVREIRPYMLYPAATWHHKNHARLLQAFRLLADKKDFEGDLVVSGSPLHEQESLDRIVVELGLGERIRFMGFVPRHTLRELYRGARLLVFPSLFEGFGYPVAEAMAMGLPVACSNTTSLPEIAGDAAEFFDPMDVPGMADTVYRLWNDDQRRQTLRSRGLQRVQMFSLPSIARCLEEEYKKLA